MKRLPVSVLVALSLIGLTAVFWLVFAALIAFGMIPSLNDLGGFRWVMAVFALGVSVFLAGMVVLLARRFRFAYSFALILLGVIAVLSVSDQMGWLDWLGFAICLIALGLLIKDRSWYLGGATRKGSPYAGNH